MRRSSTRRDFLRQGATAGIGYWALGGISPAQESKSANEKLNIAVIGCGGRGAANLASVASENIVALCDVDEVRAADAFKKYPDVKKYRDFRRMLDEMHKQIDAVVVSTPDHTHAPASIMAMKLGKHVYCEKPLTHSVYEARLMRETAARMKVATQMGNQGSASNNLRQTVEIIQAGAIGKVTEAHVWSNRPIWAQGIDRPKETQPIPATLDWDLWLGPAPERPYHSAYLPFRWRGWFDFGTGALGDMACHTANMPFMGLKLGFPTSVEPIERNGITEESFPKSSIIRYQFPARGDLPPVTFTWYDGGKRPPEALLQGQKPSASGVLLIGDKGTLYAPGDNVGTVHLLPEEAYKGYQPPKPTLPRSPGHHREWILACKGGPPALSNFDYAAFLTEVVVLGNVALRLGKKIDWDGPSMKAVNCPEAEPLIRREYHKGWTL